MIFVEFVTKKKKVAGTKFLCGFLRLRCEYTSTIFSAEVLVRCKLHKKLENLELGHPVYTMSRCSVRLETASIRNIFAY